ncbi:hypothetical protein LTS10_011524 [Elasticomyces elasticus]|nr:hypothetical protein LTS10_011524 [Elasticomyces elasticus]
MDDPVEAKALIEQIRRAKQVDNIDGENENASDLENALKMLSEELYSTPTHFILELIQNADDNHYYAGTKPKLTMLYHESGYLWIGCNEIGFTASNVRAICRIHNSTKKVEDSKKGYIGEKGIGFKSVFTVADKVWIKSGALSFLFDTTKPLGMIAPEWADLPSPQLVRERTVICLQIPKPSDRNRVQRGLKDLKPELLVFLRQLRSIEVEARNLTNRPLYGCSITREDGELQGIKVTKLKDVARVPTSTERTDMLLVFEQTVPRMPAEDKRPGVTETTLVMAFPVNEKYEAKVREQNTFAFLPVRAYGLPFLMQADFILNAGREEILHDRAWNKSLVVAALDLFITAVDTFNKTGLMKYTWPQYARSQGTSHGTIFEDFFKNLGNRLKRHKVLESRAGTLESPILSPQMTMQTMPNTFIDEAGRPLMVRPGGAKTYASPLYSRDNMAALGVAEMTSYDFCEMLGNYVLQNPANFASRPVTWHSSMAKAMVQIGASNFRNLNIIPLRNGQWISGNNKPFFFGELDGSLIVPKGIDIAMIATEPAKDWARRKLYIDLGAQNLDISKVYKMIVEQHQRPGQALAHWMAAEVVGHACFLFTAPSKPAYCDVSGLLMAIEGSGSIRLGRYLYMDVPGATVSVSELLAGCPEAKFISKSYYESAPINPPGPWLTWLQKELKVNTLPRLQDAKHATISPEFRWLVENKPSSVWLALLRDNWEAYAHDIANNVAARNYLSAASVMCTDRKKRPMREVYLPAAVKDDSLAARVAPILAVDEPNDPKWIRLTGLGLSATPTTKLYLNVLKMLTTLPKSEFTGDDVMAVYTALYRRQYAESDIIKKAFQVADLVCVPLAKGPTWVALKDARWSAPTCLLHVTSLQSFYPDLRLFFTKTLGIRDATVVDVVDRLLECSGQVQHISEIKSLLNFLSRAVSSTKVPVAQDIIDRLLGSSVRVLPVQVRDKEVELRSTKDQSWFYADTSELRNAFAGKVALLEFDMIGSPVMTAFVKKLGQDGRKLSMHVVEETVTAGEQVEEPKLAEGLKAKAKFIKFLVPLHARESTLQRLASLVVYSAGSLTLKRSVQVNGHAVYSTDGHGHILKSESAGRLVVHVSGTLVEKGSVPPKLLRDWLMNTFGISADKRQYLLEILDAVDDVEAKSMLEQAGLMADLPEIDEGEEIIDDLDVAGEETPTASSAGTTDKTPVSGPSARDTPRSKAAPPSRSAPQSDSTARRNDATGGLLRDATNGQTPRSNGSKGASKTMGVSVPGSEGRFARPDLAIDAVNIETFSMDAMCSALPQRPSSSGGTVSSGGRLGLNSHGGGFNLDEADPQAQEVGSKGELFVYKLLTTQFEASADCWTSKERSQHGLPDFADDEYFYTDFTIDKSNTQVCDRITKWLLSAGHSEIKRYTKAPFTYRFEVKATTGPRDEPFSMSYNQYEQARACHIGDNDAYVILRVYDLAGEARVCAYVDPHGQDLNKKLRFTPGKYFVQPM